MRIVFYLCEASGLNTFVRAVGRRLPTSRFNQLTPFQKIQHWFGFGPERVATNPGGAMVNRAVVRGARSGEQWFFAFIHENVSWMSPFTNAFLQTQGSRLTTVNHWRSFFWGRDAIYRGRETYQRRVLGACLRAGGFGTPFEAVKTIAVGFALGMLKRWWDELLAGGGGVDTPAPVDPPPPEMPPQGRTVTGRDQKHAGRVGFRLPPMHIPRTRTRRTLRDLVIFALMSMGMSRQGAEDLVDGEVIYGADADVYRQICRLIFIQCLACEDMTAIDHEELLNAVVYFPDDDMLVSWCPSCGTYCEANVTTLMGDRVFNL
ncbi:hypothetical protein [Dyella sp.]|uniref:hypothetical protein n=1 Tax=Dyella sp. TaxID=1869338 RepID=UPI00284C703B|nr:hypothetical protein [Dyella sp.]MDR3443679.1 hypothetical protein [Dyella sp.]